MGIKLIILLALLVGVLFSLHLLVQDYQALTAPKLLRFLFKRDLNSQMYPKPGVRWKRILFHDPIQCARYLYCEIGARPSENYVTQGFAFMLTLQPHEEDRAAWGVFKEAYRFGSMNKPSETEKCRTEYFLCPFQAALLFDLIQYMLRNDFASAQTSNFVNEIK